MGTISWMSYTLSDSSVDPLFSFCWVCPCPTYKLCWVTVSAVAAGNSPPPSHSCVMATEATAGASSQLAWKRLSPAQSAVEPWATRVNISLTGINLWLCLVFVSLFLLVRLAGSVPGEEAHHRPVRGSERWAQLDLIIRSPLWSHTGMYSTLGFSDWC